MADDDKKKTLQETAAEIAGAGISSYTHGSRSVSKISPDTLLDVDARLRARAARRRGGLFVTLNQGGGRCVAGGGSPSPSPSPSPSGDWATKASVEAVSRRVATIEGDYVTGEEVPPAAVAAVQSANLSSLTLNGERITEWPEGGASAAARVIATASGTVQDGDDLILMDGATLGAAQTLTLPNMTAEAMTVTVRQIGNYGVTITRGNNSYYLTGDGDGVTLDWVLSTATWYWRVY